MSKEKKKSLSVKSNVELLKYSVGIDISKDKFDACISAIGSAQNIKIIATRTFKNQTLGFNEFNKWTENKFKQDIPIVFTMEATGVYYENLAFYLNDKGYYVSVVLPNRAKNYLRSLGYKSKNDKIDAKGLSRMGAEQCLSKWEAPEISIMNLRAITRQRQNLQEIKTQLNNQILACKSGKLVNEDIINQLEETIRLLEKQISQTVGMIEKQVNEEEVLKSKMKKITGIKGLGLIAVSTVLAETNCFKMFKNVGQLVKYTGYDVIENQSGNHMGRTKISKKGNSRIRRILHLPAFSVVASEEPMFKALFDRVYDRTKIKMKAYVAVQRKLLVMIYVLWKNDTDYIRNYRKEYPVMQSRSSSFSSVA